MEDLRRKGLRRDEYNIADPKNLSKMLHLEDLDSDEELENF